MLAAFERRPDLTSDPGRWQFRQGALVHIEQWPDRVEQRLDRRVDALEAELQALKIRMFDRRTDDLLYKMDLQFGVCLGLAAANLVAAVALLLKASRVLG